MSATALQTPLVTVRSARPEELDGIGDLTVSAYRSDGFLAGDEEYAHHLADAAGRAAGATLLVAVSPAPDGDQVLGSLTIAPAGSGWAEVAGPGEWELRMLSVDPAHRRRGAATSLITAAQRFAVARRGSLVLSTRDIHRDARRLYLRSGFRPAPQRDWSVEGIRLEVLTWHPAEAPSVTVERDTWLPVRSERSGDWQLGFSGGLTRRANSAIPVVGGSQLSEDVLTEVERRCAEAGQPALFRVYSTAPVEVDRLLAGRGYRETAITEVWVRDLTGGEGVAHRSADASSPGTPSSAGDPVAPADPAIAPDPSAGPAIDEAQLPSPAWLAMWLGAKVTAGSADADLARELLTGSPARYLTAVAAPGPSGAEDAFPLGVLRVALAEDWAGLSCLTVDPAARRRGVGRRLTLAGLAAAREAGARRVFLQVEAGNTPAVRLYRDLGFTPAERYSYRERPTDQAGILTR